MKEIRAERYFTANAETQPEPLIAQMNKYVQFIIDICSAWRSCDAFVFWQPDFTQTHSHRHQYSNSLSYYASTTLSIFICVWIFLNSLGTDCILSLCSYTDTYADLRRRRYCDTNTCTSHHIVLSWTSCYFRLEMSAFMWGTTPTQALVYTTLYVDTLPRRYTEWSLSPNLNARYAITPVFNEITI